MGGLLTLKAATKIILGIAVLAIIITLAFMFPLSPSQEDQDPQLVEARAISECCATFIDSDYKDFSTCSISFDIALATALIHQDKSVIEQWHLNISSFERNFPEIIPLLDAKQKMGEYYVDLFENVYLKGSNDVELSKSELISFCNSIYNETVTDPSGKPICEGFGLLLDLDSPPYLPGMLVAKSYVENENACTEGGYISVNLCEAVAKKDASLC